jgi:hypothetical protein
MRAGLSENITKLVQSRGPAIFEDFDDAQRSRKEEKKPIAQHSYTDRLHNRHLDWLDDSSIFNWRGDQSDMDSDDDVFEIFEKRRANRAEPSPLRTMSPIMSQPAPSTSTPMHPTQEVVSNSGRKPRTRTTSLGAGLAEGFNVRKMSQLSRTKSFQEISAALSSGVDLMESPTIETR